MHKDSIHKHDGHDTQAVDSTVMCWAGVIGRHVTALTGDWNFRGLTKRSDKLMHLPFRQFWDMYCML